MSSIKTMARRGELPVRAAKFLAADTIPRDALDTVLERLETSCGKPIEPQGGFYTFRFGNPRSPGELTTGQGTNARRWYFLPDLVQAWSKIVAGAKTQPGLNENPIDQEAVKQIAIMVQDEPSLPDLVVIAKVDLQPTTKLDVDQCYRAVWAIKDWIGDLLQKTPGSFRPVSVTELLHDLPNDYASVTRALHDYVITRESLSTAAEVDAANDTLKGILEPVDKLVPFSFSKGNHRASRFIAFSNLHVAMGHWGFMAGLGDGAWLVQTWTQDANYDAARNETSLGRERDRFFSRRLEMPGDLSLPDMEASFQFLLPLLVGRWSLDFLERLRVNAKAVGEAHDLLQDASEEDRVKLLSDDVRICLRELADLTRVFHSVKRLTAPGMARLAAPRGTRGLEVSDHVPDRLDSFQSLGDQLPTVQLGKMLQDVMAEVELHLSFAEREVSTLAQAVSTDLQITYTAKQYAEAKRTNWLAWATLVVSSVALFIAWRV